MHRVNRLFLPAALLVVLGLSGCNTVEGMGEDISALGQGIENTASRNSDKKREAEAQQQAEAPSQPRQSTVDERG